MPNGYFKKNSDGTIDVVATEGEFVNATVSGTITGDVTGDVTGDITGDVSGTVNTNATLVPQVGAIGTGLAPVVTQYTSMNSLVTEITTALPEQSNRQELFTFVEGELLEIADLLAPDGSNEYGRVDQVAAWALLSRLYLNAEVWTGNPKLSK